MRFLDLSLPALAENLALDEALLLEAEAGRGGEVLRVWEWPAPAVVMGAACRLAEEVDEVRCRKDGVPILRRASGGGTVLLGAGCLCYSLVLAYDRDPALHEIPSSYAFILDLVRSALIDIEPGVTCAGTSDLAAGGRKFSGSAQQRKRSHLLHHGTILYDFDFDRVGRYLPMPPRQPDYRQRRGHGDFLRNLPCAPEELKRRLRATWKANIELTTWPITTMRQLIDEKYSNDQWLRRR